MTRLLRFALVIVLLAVPAIALGAEIQGKAKAIDSGDRVGTLEDGTRISIPDGIALDGLTQGAESTVSYAGRDGENEATSAQRKQRVRRGTACDPPAGPPGSSGGGRSR